MSQSKTVQKHNIEVKLSGRDELRLLVESQDGQILKAQLQGIGCLPFLRLLAQYRPQLKGSMEQLAAPVGSGHGEMMLREAILRLQGKWKLPYTEAELCHCRAVPTEKVDQAILGGFHTVESVGRETSAGTACGTCRPDIEALLKYRKGTEQA